MEFKEDCPMDRIDYNILTCLQNDDVCPIRACCGCWIGPLLAWSAFKNEQRIITGYEARVDFRALSIGLQALLPYSHNARHFVDDFREHHVSSWGCRTLPCCWAIRLFGSCCGTRCRASSEFDTGFFYHPNRGCQAQYLSCIWVYSTIHSSQLYLH